MPSFQNAQAEDTAAILLHRPVHESEDDTQTTLMPSSRESSMRCVWGSFWGLYRTRISEKISIMVVIVIMVIRGVPEGL